MAFAQRERLNYGDGVVPEGEPLVPLFSQKELLRHKGRRAR